MSQSVSLSSATAPSSSGARAHTRAFTRQLAELETPLSLRTNQPEIGPSFLQLLQWSTPPPSGRKYGRPQYQSSDNSSDADEYDEDFAFHPRVQIQTLILPVSPLAVHITPSVPQSSFPIHHPQGTVPRFMNLDHLHHLPIHPHSVHPSNLRWPLQPP